MHKSSGPDSGPLIFSGFCGAVAASAQRRKSVRPISQGVTEETCLRGDCVSGEGTLELTTEFGKGATQAGSLTASLKAMVA